MSAFDFIRPINIQHEKFKHNNIEFQTQCLACASNSYIIFNNQLWLAYDGASDDQTSLAQPVEINEQIQIYTTHTDNMGQYWLEYSLTFQAGTLTNVEVVRIELIKDLRDLSHQRPKEKPSNAAVSIRLPETNQEMYEHFHANLDANLDAIRSMIGDPCATISYPVKNSGNNPLYLTKPNFSIVHNVVQSAADFKRVITNNKPAIEISDTQNNPIRIFIDEYGFL